MNCWKVALGCAFVLTAVILPGIPTATADTNAITLRVGEEEYLMRFKLSGATLVDARADPDSKKITITINSTDEGKFSLDMDRGVIQAQREPTGQDLPFVVRVDGEEVLYTDLGSNSQSRAIEIPFKSGQSEIEIIGTWMVPEFPMAIVGLIVGFIAVIRLFNHPLRH
jgi:hypothetical protein